MDHSIGEVLPNTAWAKSVKRGAVQEIEDVIMLFAAANGGRSPWRKVNVNALRRFGETDLPPK
jgi:hypothetical protein